MRSIERVDGNGPALGRWLGLADPLANVDVGAVGPHAGDNARRFA